MRISDVRYQQRAQRLIQHALTGDRLPHAYIFHGPSGVGKEMLALRLAKTLLCDQPAPWPAEQVEQLGEWAGDTRDACGTCRSCHLVDVGNHPDLHLIYRQLNQMHPDRKIRNQKALEMGVEVIRHFVVDAVGMSPARGKAKVFVIREADIITPDAQNALLKTLEEPPASTSLILLASSLDRLLSTTRSRCQAVPFSPLPTAFVEATVREGIPDISPESAALYAELSQGSAGTALAYAQDDLAAINEGLSGVLAALNPSTARLTSVQLLDDAKAVGERIQARDSELTETDVLRQGLRAVFVLIATWYRDVLHVMHGSEDRLANRGSIGLLRTAASSLSAESAASAIRYVAEAERQIRQHVNVQLCIEQLTFKMASGATAPGRNRTARNARWR